MRVWMGEGAPARNRCARAWLALLSGLLIASGLLGCGSIGRAPAPSPVALPVLGRPPQLAGYHVFVTDSLSGDVAELGIGTVHVARSVHGLGLSHDGQTLYISDISAGRLVAYTLRAGALGASRAVAAGSQPVHMVNSSDGRTIFVTNFGGQTISVIDAAGWTRKADITVPARPHGIVLSPDGRWAYVACSGGPAVAILDTASATLAATIALPPASAPTGIATSRDGRYIYVSDTVADRLFVIAAATRQVLRSVALGQRPALVARSPDGATLYVTNGASASVSVLDLARDPARPTVRATVHVDGYPHGLALTPDGRYLIVANTVGKDLSVIATDTEQVIATIPAGSYPNDVLVTARGFSPPHAAVP